MQAKSRLRPPSIELQLRALKDQTRADPDAHAYIWGMASQLNDASINGLATYCSQQSGARVGAAMPPSSRRANRYLPRVPDDRFQPAPHATVRRPKATDPFRASLVSTRHTYLGNCWGPECVAHGAGHAQSN
jgi:hypothetical protein